MYNVIIEMQGQRKPSAMKLASIAEVQPILLQRVVCAAFCEERLSFHTADGRQVRKQV